MPNYELEVVPGLERMAIQELVSKQIAISAQISVLRPGNVVFTTGVTETVLATLNLSIAVYRVLTFDAPRPKALLGHQTFHRITDEINDVINRDQQVYETLSIDAAGSGSSVMVRLKEALADGARLHPSNDKGDLQLRIRPTPGSRSQWDVLLRLTPRPLATRFWRVVNFQGALDATVAYGMAQLAQPTLNDVVVNLMCGSGSLLIERALSLPARQIIGLDNSPDVLTYAHTNVAAAGVNQSVDLIHGDATRTPFATQSVTYLMSDLPFGHLVGSHDINRSLYPAVLDEAARIAEPNASFVLLTHEVRLLETLLKDRSTIWKTVDELKINLSGLHPRIFHLRRLP